MGKASTFPERKKAAMYTKFESWQSKAAALLVVILVAIQPLYLHPRDRYVRLTGHKFMFFVIYMAVMLLVVAIIWLIRMASKPKLGIREGPYLADWAVLGFALVTLLATLFTPFKGAIREITGEPVNLWIGIPERDGRYDGAITQFLYVAIFLIVAHWYKPNTRHFTIFGISAILVALIGILQFFGYDFLKLWPRDNPLYRIDNYYNIFFRSTLGNVNIVSTYVCVAILIFGFLYIKTSSKWLPLWLAASTLNFWLMELADSDSGRVGVIVALLLAIPFIIENMKTIGKTMILAASWILSYTLHKILFEVINIKTREISSLLPFIAAGLVLLAIGVLFAIRGKPSRHDAPVRWKLGVILIAACIAFGIAGVEVLGRRDAASETPGFLYELRELLHGNVDDEFGTNRAYIWRNALAVYPQHPLIGTGPDTFEHAFPEEAHMKYGERYDKAHNEYLQILICQGILGLICYLVFLIAASIKAVPLAFKNPLLMAILAAFIGYCVQAFFNISVPIASQLLWVLAGMLANRRVREFRFE